MKKIFFLLILILLFLVNSLAPVSKVFADENFTVRYDLTYEVDISGMTDVIYQINITNLTTQYYVSEYDLIIPSTQIRDVVAADSLGKIIPKITVEDSRTKIRLTLNGKVVGRGNVLSFVVSYKSPEITQKNGRIWEITLPPKTDNPGISDYDVHLKVPSIFGPPSYVWPTPTSGLNWTKDQLKSGVVLAFGDYQLFHFNLKYHLDNRKLFPIYTEIALPSDNAYQKIKFEEINPRPVKVRKDEDGNWLARFDLSPGEKIDISISGLVKILSFPDPDFSQKMEKPSKRHLLAQKYWETTDGEIQRLAQKLKTPKQIYDYVVSNLKYDYVKAQEGGKRIGAKEALKNPEEAICMEFTDLFIALTRAAGIPSREVDGFAYTTNSKLRPLSAERDILHSWPQYWDSERKAWLMVDPTWGATTGGIDYFSKLDFNHFALAIRGFSSEFPPPAGAYKLDGQEGKDVEVDFALKDWEEISPQLEVVWNLPKWTASNIGLNGSVEIKNGGLVAAYGKQISMGSSPPGILKNKNLSLTLAPGESYKLNLEFEKPGWFKTFQGTLFVTLDQKTFSRPFNIRSLGLILVAVVFSFSLLTSGAIFSLKIISRSKKQLPQQNDQLPS